MRELREPYGIGFALYRFCDNLVIGEVLKEKLQDITPRLLCRSRVKEKCRSSEKAP